MAPSPQDRQRPRHGERPTHVDVLVIGGGMAGVTVAAALAPRRRVLLVEAEPQLAFHSTGRSAAAFLETYGPPEVRHLTRASRAAMDEASADPLTPAILTLRPLLWLARPDQLDHFDALTSAQPGLERLDPAQAAAILPVVRPGYLGAAALERNAADIDVAALHQHHLRALRRAGGHVSTSAPALGGERPGAGPWRVRLGTPEGTRGATTTVEADVIVNAAGAWADVVASRFGARPVGLRPLRRTAAVARSAVPVDPRWPLAADVGDTFYVKPEGDHVLVSPADETPSEPGDARADELDVARALERVNAATTLDLRSVVRAWAGLRTFAPDGNPVVGPDPDVGGFVWLAGQGGYGIQLAPALAALAAALATDGPRPEGLDGLDITLLAPGRRRPGTDATR